MFEITNKRKAGELTFYNIKNRHITLHPEQTRSFRADDLHHNILRAMIGPNSFFGVKAASERAEQMLVDAGKRPDKKGPFKLVHGLGDRSREEVSANSDKVIPVRDLKTPAKAIEAAADVVHQPLVTDPANPELPPVPPAAPEPSPAAPPPPEPPLEPTRKERAAGLLAGIDEAPIGELQASAREVLGDDYPKGNAGRKAIKEALAKVE